VCLEALEEQGIGRYILNEEAAVSFLAQINVTEKQAIRFTNGGQLGFERLHLKDVCEGQLFRVKFNDLLLGIGFADIEKQEIGIKCIINYPKDDTE